MAKYQFKKGSRFNKAQRALVNDVGKELEDIKRGKGDIPAAEIVRRARRKSNPMHAFFTWNNSDAAHEHRLSQARHLSRSIEITIHYKVGKKTKPVIVRAFYTENPTSQGGPYSPMIEILKDSSRRARMVSIALQEAEQWRDRWAHLEDLRIIFDAIDRAKARKARSKKKQKKSA